MIDPTSIVVKRAPDLDAILRTSAPASAPEPQVDSVKLIIEGRTLAGQLIGLLRTGEGVAHIRQFKPDILKDLASMQLDLRTYATNDPHYNKLDRELSGITRAINEIPSYEEVSKSITESVHEEYSNAAARSKRAPPTPPPVRREVITPEYDFLVVAPVTLQSKVDEFIKLTKTPDVTKKAETLMVAYEIVKDVVMSSYNGHSYNFMRRRDMRQQVENVILPIQGALGYSGEVNPEYRDALKLFNNQLQNTFKVGTVEDKAYLMLVEIMSTR